ncbi:MAG: cohesin domain-containing protein, partial [Archaeoglobaceae archaeon]
MRMVLKMRKLMAFIATFIFILLVSTGTAAAQSVSVSPQTTDGLCPNDTFTVDVDVDSGESSLRALQVQLDYDESALEVTDIDDGDVFDDTGFLVIT